MKQYWNKLFVACKDRCRVLKFLGRLSVKKKDKMNVHMCVIGLDSFGCIVDSKDLSQKFSICEAIIE